MKLSLQELQLFVKESLQEKQWNKNSNTPRDYSKEYNPPGSKEQEDRNKRKRDKRKHDKENGECPEGEELHHVDGIEEDELKCEPTSKNRGRKGEGARYTKNIKIKIKKSSLEEIIKEESDIVIQEIFGSLAGAALGAAAKSAAGWAAEKAGEEAMEMAFGDDEEEAGEEGKKKQMKQKMTGLNIRSYDDLRRALDGVFDDASKTPLSGDSKELEKHLASSSDLIKQLRAK